MSSEKPQESRVILADEMTFEKVLHKKTGISNTGMSAMLNKDHKAQEAASKDYFRHWDNKAANVETEETRAARAADYESLSKQYYNLATDFYEYGFGQSFHFSRAATGESFMQSIIRHEHYLAHAIDIKPGMKVLDVGCGVGGPAREIAKFTGAHITGLNLNEYQVERARRYATKQGMSDQLEFVQGDFMNIPADDETFDAVYAIEATVHAPSLEDVYSEIYRVLKPGGTFGVYEWVMTEKYDNENLAHRDIRINIEQGDGIANMVKESEAVRAIQAAGFELLVNEDMAERPDPIPWYWPLDSGSWRHAQTVGDLLYTFRMTMIGRNLTRCMLSVLETVRLAPPGMVKTSDSLCAAADALVLGAKEKLFTPMYLMVGRKPSN